MPVTITEGMPDETEKKSFMEMYVDLLRQVKHSRKGCIRMIGPSTQY